MVKVRSVRMECKRCGHRWIPRGDEVRICAKCKSPYWDQARKEKAHGG